MSASATGGGLTDREVVSALASGSNSSGDEFCGTPPDQATVAGCPYDDHSVEWDGSTSNSFFGRGRDNIDDLFAGNVIIGENHDENLAKMVIRALLDRGYHRHFVMEQVRVDMSSELQQLLAGVAIEELPLLCAHLKEVTSEDAHGSDFLGLFAAFQGKGIVPEQLGASVADGVAAEVKTLRAIDRVKFDYKEGSKGVKRVVGMNQDCETYLQDLIESNFDDVMAGKCVFFVGNQHVGQHTEDYLEPGLSHRLNMVIASACQARGVEPSVKSLFRGVCCLEAKTKKEGLVTLPCNRSFQYGIIETRYNTDCVLIASADGAIPAAIETGIKLESVKDQATACSTFEDALKISDVPAPSFGMEVPALGMSGGAAAASTDEDPFLEQRGGALEDIAFVSADHDASGDDPPLDDSPDERGVDIASEVPAADFVNTSPDAHKAKRRKSQPDILPQASGVGLLGAGDLTDEKSVKAAKSLLQRFLSPKPGDGRV